jgi:hypothetical protein
MSENETKSGISKRKQTRYAVTEDCRIRASISIRSSDTASAGKDWPGTLVDMSSGGAHIQISMAAVAFTGDTCVLKLALGGVKLELRGVLAHYVCSARYSVCGVKFDAFVAGWDKAYLPFYKAVIASSTLKGGATDSDVPAQYREEYKGAGHAKLVVHRNNKPERAVVSFDYTMARYAAALAGAGADMLENKKQVAFRSAPAEGGSGGGGALTAAQEAEARWEFSLAASNLQSVVPADLRKFLRLVS